MHLLSTVVKCDKTIGFVFCGIILNKGCVDSTDFTVNMYKMATTCSTSQLQLLHSLNCYASQTELYQRYTAKYYRSVWTKPEESSTGESCMRVYLWCTNPPYMLYAQWKPCFMNFYVYLAWCKDHLCCTSALCRCCSNCNKEFPTTPHNPTLIISIHHWNKNTVFDQFHIWHTGKYYTVWKGICTKYTFPGSSI